MIVYDDEPGMIAWAEQRIGLGEFSAGAHAIGMRDAEGELIAVAVFDAFEPWGCEISFATARRRWFSRDFALAVSVYVFVQLKLERMTCRVAANNLRAQRLARALGFKPEGRQRRLTPDDDRLMFGMLCTECRFLSMLPLAIAR